MNIHLNARFSEENAADFDEIVVATGVSARKAGIEGENHPSVLSYTDVVLHRKPVGKAVAIIGAGGIGFDVATFLGSKPKTTIAAFMKEWGVDTGYLNPGAKQKPEPEAALREVYLLQRSGGKMGQRLGKTTGWIHRSSLKMKKVKMISGVSYQYIDDAGLHISVNKKEQTLHVDNIVVCAGQVSENQLFEALKSTGKSVHLIGGAAEAGELDAKRAIAEGTELGLSI